MAAAMSLYSQELQAMGIKEKDVRWTYSPKPYGEEYDVWGATQEEALIALRRYGFLHIDVAKLKRARPPRHVVPVLTSDEIDRMRGKK